MAENSDNQPSMLMRLISLGLSVKEVSVLIDFTSKLNNPAYRQALKIINESIGDSIEPVINERFIDDPFDTLRYTKSNTLNAFESIDDTCIVSFRNCKWVNLLKQTKLCSFWDFLNSLTNNKFDRFFNNLAYQKVVFPHRIEEDGRE